MSPGPTDLTISVISSSEILSPHGSDKAHQACGHTSYKNLPRAAAFVLRVCDGRVQQFSWPLIPLITINNYSDVAKILANYFYTRCLIGNGKSNIYSLTKKLLSSKHSTVCCLTNLKSNIDIK